MSHVEVAENTDTTKRCGDKVPDSKETNNNTNGRTWHLSVLPIDWKDGKPVLAPEKLPR